MRSATPWRDKLFLWLGLGKKRTSFLPVDIYSEMEYRDLVQREFKRSEQSRHLCRILLVYSMNQQGLIVPLGSNLADKAASLLSSSCRDTDYIGWYRQGHILGVLLTTLQRDSVVDGCKTLQARLVDRLCGVLALTDAHSIHMHVLDPGELATFNPSDHIPSSSVSKNQVL